MKCGECPSGYLVQRRFGTMIRVVCKVDKSEGDINDTCYFERTIADCEEKIKERDGK